MPDKPFVRSECLESYRRARDEGLPEITRKDYNLLNYIVAITRAVLLRRHLRKIEDESLLHHYVGDEVYETQIIRPPMSLKSSGLQRICGTDVIKGTPLLNYKEALADVGCQFGSGRIVPKIDLFDVHG